MKQLFKAYSSIFFFVLVPAAYAMAQTMTLNISNTTSPGNPNHVVVTVTPSQNFNSGSSRTWASSNITFRIKKVLSTNTVNQGQPSPNITGISSAFSGMAYTDLITGSPAAGGLSLYDGTNIGGSADPTYWYFTITGGGNNQNLTASVPINLLTFDLPTSWGNGTTDLIEIVTTQPASIPVGLDEMFPSIYNAGVNNATTNIVVVGNSSAILPIALSSFTGTASSCTANLVWQTASEINSSSFAIQASSDGSNFSQVGKVASLNSSTGASYTYSYALASGTTYFRLKMVDKDGTFAYSGVVAVTGTGACGTGLSVKVSPNPTSNMVYIQGLSAKSHISITTLSGQKLAELTSGGTSQGISLSGYASGVYVVRIQAADGTITNVKVVKK